LRYTHLAVPSPADLVFGRAPKPLSCGFGLTIGQGMVFPEVNFTLPPLALTSDTWPEAVRHYEEMAEAIIRRALALRLPGLVLELELLPPMTERPEWGAQITTLLRDALQVAHEASGLPSALRVTPIDMRYAARPPRLRQGEHWEGTRASLEQCADASAHILSIESEGGKEVSDEALLNGDIQGMVFALGVLACRDMAWLWDQIGAICRGRAGVVPGGDSACAFGNTAMQLAHQRLLPETFAATVRAMTAPRSLVAFEHGAIGPSKDCAYEGPVLKAIAGCPISMEGKASACAHFSPVGNIAAACCDLWSNESVQNVRLLSGFAPEVFTEILAYDCRLMNEALRRGEERCLRDLMVESDRYVSPQALVLSPEASLAIAEAVVGEDGDYGRTAAAARTAVELIRTALDEGKLALPDVEIRWLGRIEQGLTELPSSEDALIERMMPTYGNLFDPASYGL
jgi:methanol--5-hydroxybenzimidazolylcobamide Co-methyltransferase